MSVAPVTNDASPEHGNSITAAISRACDMRRSRTWRVTAVTEASTI
jgi:hypothetical protein